MNYQEIAVIGLGRVGLTLALTLAEEGFSVAGIETSPEVLRRINKIQSPFFEPGMAELLKKHIGKKFNFFDHLPDRNIQTYLLCVGTPLKDGQPDLWGAETAIREIGRHFQEGALVILRSTVPVGTSRKIFLPILQNNRKKFYYACCPERTREGVALKELRELPQVIGGLDEASLEMAASLFQNFAPTLVKAASLEEAEMVKLMDNCWRDTTFAFANEMASLCEGFGIDATQVIKLANLGYSRNTIPRPGLVGGPCLTKDPYLLAHPAKIGKMPLALILTARGVNQNLPQRVWERIRQFLKKQNKEIQNCKIFLLGLAFKGDPATDDLRGSPGLDLLKILKEKGARSLFVHDFVIPEAVIARHDIPHALPEEGFRSADIVMILNNHKASLQLDIPSLLRTMNAPALFFDACRLFSREITGQVPGVTHGGIGF